MLVLNLGHSPLYVFFKSSYILSLKHFLAMTFSCEDTLLDLSHNLSVYWKRAI